MYAREKYVYDQIIANQARFSEAEIKAAKGYIDSLKKAFDAGLID